MELLRTLINLSSYEPEKGDLLKLFQLLNNDDFSRAEVLSKFESGSHFRQVNKKLKEKLLDDFLGGSFKELEPVIQQQFKIRKQALEVILLFQLDKRSVAVKLAVETLQAAIKYGQLDIALDLSAKLEHHYSVTELNSAKRKRYRQKHELFDRLTSEYSKCERVYNELAVLAQKNKAVEHLAPKIAALGIKVEENDYYKFRILFYATKILYAQVRNNVEGIAMVCNDAIDYLNDTKTVLPRLTQFNFKFQLIPVYLSQGKYSEAEKAIMQVLSYPKKGSYNWHHVLLYKAVLGFYSDKPQMSRAAYQQAQAAQKKFQSPLLEEQWKLVRAYLAWYEKIGRLPDTGQYRVYRFLNEVTALKSDQLLIIELLHLLVANKKKKYMERAESILPFIKNNKPSPRTKHFLKMLWAVEQGDYNEFRVEEHARKHLKALRRVPAAQTSVNVFDTELVKYEMLWEGVVRCLER